MNNDDADPVAVRVLPLRAFVPSHLQFSAEGLAEIDRWAVDSDMKLRAASSTAG